jgi:hypothetical protein
MNSIDSKISKALKLLRKHPLDIEKSEQTRRQLNDVLAKLRRPELTESLRWANKPTVNKAIQTDKAPFLESSLAARNAGLPQSAAVLLAAYFEAGGELDRENALRVSSNAESVELWRKKSTVPAKQFEQDLLGEMPAIYTTAGVEWLLEHGDVKKLRPLFLRLLRCDFLVPKAGTTSLFDDAELIFQARCGHLTQRAWSTEPRYYNLRTEFDRPITASLKTRFDRFAILRRWDFLNPGSCVFDLEPVTELATSLPKTIEDKIKADIYDATEFETFVLSFVAQPRTVGELFRELAEPFSDRDAIPFLGDTQTYEELLRLAARGRIAVNVNNTWFTRDHNDEDDDAA